MMMQYEFEQMQDCITSLFDCFERVQLEGQPLESSLRKLIEQNIGFARKMVELSEKFDELYSRESQEHNQEIRRMIRKVYGLMPGHRREGVEIVDMLEAVADQLNKRNQSNQNSRHNTNMRDSKRSRGKSETENSMPVNRTNRKPSSNKTISLKEALTLKRALEVEEQTIRLQFESLQRMLSDSQLPVPQAEKYKYQKHYAQEDEAASVMALVKGNIDSNSTNLQKFCGLLHTVSEDVLKCLRRGSSSHGRVGLYLTQIQQREEVFSYTVSKILQSFRSLSKQLEGRSQTRGNMQNLEELLNKLFDIYPSADLLKDIHLTSPEAKQRKVQEYIGNSKEVQVNIKPKENKELKKQQIELFRIGVRLNEWLKKIADAVRYKKSVDARELDKWLENLRENLTVIHESRPLAGKEMQAEMAAFDEQYRRLQTETEVRQNELRGEYGKHISKLEKAMRGYEADIEQLKSELAKADEKYAKLLKKLDHEKQEVSKVKAQKDSLNDTIHSLQQQLDQLRSTIKTDQKEQSKQSKIARSEQELITREKERIEDQLRRLTRSLEDKELSVEQERSIYKSKIKLIEEREAEIKDENGRLKQELEAMIGDNRVLKQRVQHMGQLYEEKIKESEELIDQFKKTEDELAQRDLEYREAKVQMIALKESLTQIDQELTAKAEEFEKMAQDKLKAEDNARKYKQLGRLNQEDIQVLKQQIEKVKNAYFDAEEQLVAMREACEMLTEEKMALTDAKHKYSEMLEDMEGDLEEQKRFRDRSEEAIRLNNEQLQAKQKELDELNRHLESYKEDRKELAKYKKENAELRSNLSTIQLQLATIRHDVQNASLLQEATSSQQKKDLRANNSKYQLEVESLRVELKHCKDTIQRDRNNFERERGLLQQKITDLKALLNEKESLASRLKLARHYQSLQGDSSNNG